MLALQGDSRRTPRLFSRWGDAARGPRSRRSRGARRADHPRRRIDRDDARDRARGPGGAAAGAGGRGMPVLGTCAGLIMLDRDHLDALDIPPSATRSGASCGRLRPTWTSPGLTGADPRGVHPRSLGGRARTGRRGPGERRRPPGAIRQGNVIAVSFHPELAGETRLHRLLLGAQRCRPVRSTLDGPSARARRMYARSSRSNAGQSNRGTPSGLRWRTLVGGIVAVVGAVVGLAVAPRQPRGERTHADPRGVDHRRPARGGGVSDASAPTAYRSKRRGHQPPQL